MLEFLMGFCVIGIAALLQTAVLSRLPMVHGIADILMLLVIGWTIQPSVKYPWIWVLLAGLSSTMITSMVSGVIPLAYGLVFMIAFNFRQRFWRARLLTMVSMSLIGTIIVHLFSFSALAFRGNFLSISESFYLITLPSVLLNFLFAIPVYILTRELVRWLYPEKIEV